MHILVAAPAHGEHHDLVFTELHLGQCAENVGRLQCRNDTLKAGQLKGSADVLVVVDRIHLSAFCLVEVAVGRASILATVNGGETREYQIEIEKICSPGGETRNLLLRVTDEDLLAQTGGVVQGMVVSYNRDNSGEKPLRRKALRACRIGAPVRRRRGQYGTTPFLQTG